MNDAAVQGIAIRYMTRAYGNADGTKRCLERQFTDNDTKMINTMGKLQTSYQKLKDNRKRTLLTSQIEIQKRDVAQREVVKQEMVKKETEKKEKVKKAQIVKDPVITCCKAFKMNGQKCTSKTKNTAFCIRHSKK